MAKKTGGLMTIGLLALAGIPAFFFLRGRRKKQELAEEFQKTGTLILVVSGSSETFSINTVSGRPLSLEDVVNSPTTAVTIIVVTEDTGPDTDPDVVDEFATQLADAGIEVTIQ